MTPADARALCTRAKLHVQAVDVLGKQVRVRVSTPLPVEVPTLVKRLGVSVTVAFGDGTGGVELYFMAKEGE